jgi:iron-sulfur cluster repair protein YtfE (RIC family)
MIELEWSAPIADVDAGTARRGILWQHERIRELLRKAAIVAESALDGEAESSTAVADVVADICSTMETHLAFEERLLIPLFAAGSVGGSRRGEQLKDEHQRQRDVLAAIHREACAQPLLPMLAAKLAFLTAWLFADMDEEEQWLLAADARV